ncbi:MAG: PHP domain-containing protein [Sporomusaceae bacterium]|nr:PHP domain-containing protein [Sporomusaceae bacterium]
MLRAFTADLHVHTLLSPCASVEMTPHHLVLQAEAMGVDILAITDHNSCDNVKAALLAASGKPVTILPGMEVETKEEAHILVLFDALAPLLAWEQIVASHRSGRRNDEEKLGAQFIVDQYDEFVAVKEEMLLDALNLTVAEVAETVEKLGGITIAAHVDRPMYSLLTQLGFIPEGLQLSALEISRRFGANEARKAFSNLQNWPLVTASDAHSLEDFCQGPRTTLYLEKVSIAEIKLALAGSCGRSALF